MASHFTSSNQGSLLYLIKVPHSLALLPFVLFFKSFFIFCLCDFKSACSFMLESFEEDASEIRQLFQMLIFKGKRDVS